MILLAVPSGVAPWPIVGGSRGSRGPMSTVMRQSRENGRLYRSSGVVSLRRVEQRRISLRYLLLLVGERTDFERSMNLLWRRANRRR